jgi:hypothetical protein
MGGSGRPPFPPPLLVVVVTLWLAGSPAAAAGRDAQVVIALREALQLAVERGVTAVARPEGFLANPAIRIGVPEHLAKVESKFRLAGQDAQVEKFIVSLNRAAEHAAPAARVPLLISVSELYLDDGQRLLTAGETTMTEALRRHGLGRAIAALTPAVAEAMDRVGTASRYKRFMKGSRFGGLVQQAPLDLDAYVVGRTIEGIFHAIGHEERRIRTDPAARPTQRLREVFGAQR